MDRGTAAAGLLLTLALVVGCGPLTPAADDRDPPPKKDKFAEVRDPKTGDPKSTDPKTPTDDKPTPFDGERAAKYVKQLCDLGPRPSGSAGMTKQQELLAKHFEGLGGTVTKQEFKAKVKGAADPVPMTNLVVSWFPDRANRVLLCSHYDTRPAADQDQKANWNKPFLSANDGTSGAAFLMELAHHMKDLPTKAGVDFALFDGEEHILTGPDTSIDEYFIGSKHFAAEYARAKGTRKHEYAAALLFDLFAHDGAKLKVEGHSWDEASALVMEVWGAAEAAKVKSFRFEKGFARTNGDAYVSDDHLPLLEAKIPTADVIDFDYEHWHKVSDTADKVSAAQMADVGKVVTTWLKARK